MLLASLAAWVPLFIATATSACARAGASLVPSPVIATSRPPVWYSRISLSLASGVASARKSSTPASAAIAAAVSRLSPVIITVLMPISRSSANRSRMPPLTMSLSWMTPSDRAPSATSSGVPPRARDDVDLRLELAPDRPSLLRDELNDGVGRPLPDPPAVEIDAAHPGLRGEGDELRAELLDRALAQSVLLLGEDHDAAPFRSLVGQRRELSRVGQLALLDPGRRHEPGRLAVAERDRPGLVEQQHVDVAGRLHRLARGRDDVGADHAVHAGDADRGEQAADGGGNEADQEGHQHGDAHRLPRLRPRSRCRSRTAAASRRRRGRSA